MPYTKASDLHPIILPAIGLITLQMVDTEGRLVMEKGSRNVPKGLNLITVDMQAYTQGTYLISVIPEGMRETKRIVKQ